MDVQVNINSNQGVLPGLFSYDARIVSPSTGSEFVVTVGETASVFIIAKGEDFASQVALSKFTGGDVTYFAGYPATLRKLDEQTKDPSATFTWAPAEPGLWEACFQLINSDGVAVDTTCIKIRALTCQHQVVPGESVDDIVNKYQVEWKTIFLLNPGMKNLQDVGPGDILNIGKLYTLGEGQTLEFLVTNLRTTWYQLALVNPRKVVAPNEPITAMTVQPASYKTSTRFSGLTYCVVTTSIPSFGPVSPTMLEVRES